jgi:hypothetical protein
MAKGVRARLFELHIFKKLPQVFTVGMLTFWKLSVKKARVVWKCSFSDDIYVRRVVNCLKYPCPRSGCNNVVYLRLSALAFLYI